MQKQLSNYSDLKILERNVDWVGQRLLGCYLERTIDGQKIVVKIVETESYDQYDAASHSYNGITPRNSSMFGPPGHVYVYFTYGMHFCANIVTGKAGEGSAVLIRAVEPVSGVKIMQRYRNKPLQELTNGPAKLCQALQIDKRMNGHYLGNEPLRLLLNEEPLPSKIAASTRIGVTKEKDNLRRYYFKNNPYISRQDVK